MTLSTSGLIGAGIGLVIALIINIAVSAVLKSRETAAGASTTVGAPDQSASMIKTILLADFVLLPAVGYYVGQMLG